MEIRDVQFPLYVAGGRMVRGIKAAGGEVLSHVWRQRFDALQRGEPGPALGRLDRLMLAALVARRERDVHAEGVSAMHRWFWSGPQAVDFHRQAEARFQSWWLDAHSDIVAPMQSLLDAAPGRYATLCEIGCGSGRILADLASRLHGPQWFLGLDLSVHQTQHNRERHAQRVDLQFATGDATRWIPDCASAGWFYFSNAGVLEYLAESDLRLLLSCIAERLRPAAFALVEPIADDFDVDTAHSSLLCGVEHTFSHPYPRLFRECGWQLQWQRDVRYAHGRHLLLVAEAT